MEIEELLTKLEGVEKKINEAINSAKPPKDYSIDDKQFREEIKNYIKKVKKMESLLDEYENLVKQVSKLLGDESDESLNKMVVDLREDTEELKNLTEIINGQVVSKQVKKKKSSSSVKEF